jgi:F-type H+-transporting ATPase subunit delta
MNPKISRRLLARTLATNMLAEPERREHWVRALAAYLVETNRTDEADQVVNAIAHELLEQDGLLAVEVTSARPLTDDIRKELVGYLKNATGAATVQFSEQVDPELVGGFIARTPDQELDTSVRSQLRRLASIS